MQRKGGYQTKQKTQILAYLQENRAKHMTAAELLHLLTENGTPIGAATVYRQLERPEADGLVRRYALDDRGSACWQYVDENQDCCSHFHLKCTVCGTLFHLDCNHLQEIASHVEHDHGFRIDPSRTVFYGICEQCSKQTAPDAQDASRKD